MAALRRITPDDLPRLKLFWREHWAGENIIVHGEVFHPECVEGFVNGDWTGLVTYFVADGGCEILSLNALKEGGGTGTALIETVVDEARGRGCQRVFLSTTNDNLHALGFYQCRGFEPVGIRRGAVTEARKRKPAIPFIGENDIPLRDEIELEFRLLPRRDLGHGT